MVFPCINVGREVESRFSTLNIRLQNCHCVYLPLVCDKYNVHCVVFSKATIPSLLFGSVLEKSWTEVHFNSCSKWSLENPEGLGKALFFPSWEAQRRARLGQRCHAGGTGLRWGGGGTWNMCLSGAVVPGGRVEPGFGQGPVPAPLLPQPRSPSPGRRLAVPGGIRAGRRRAGCWDRLPGRELSRCRGVSWWPGLSLWWEVSWGREVSPAAADWRCRCKPLPGSRKRGACADRIRASPEFPRRCVKLSVVGMRGDFFSPSWLESQLLCQIIGRTLCRSLVSLCPPGPTWRQRGGRASQTPDTKYCRTAA